LIWLYINIKTRARWKTGCDKYMDEEHYGKVDMGLCKEHSGNEEFSDIIIIMKNIIGKMLCNSIYK